MVYPGPDADAVPRLMAELLSEMNSDDGADPLVHAAMAHLNLVAAVGGPRPVTPTCG